MLFKCQMNIKKETDFKELAHVIVEAGKFKICRTDQQARDLGKC